MELVFDIGNSNIVGAVFNGDGVISSFRLLSTSQRTVDEYAIDILAMLANLKIDREDIHSVIIGSVVPPLTRVLSKFSEKYLKHTPVAVGHWSEAAPKICIDDPTTVGADRLANAVAAHRLFGGPAIVADFGTATTFDVIGKNGEYHGGAIAPGVIVSADALSSKAALLQSIEINRPPHAIGTNTRDAMLSGVILGYASLTEGMIKRIKAEMGVTATVIGTGGLSTLMSQHTDVFDHLAPDLTLQGFRWMAEKK